MAFSRLGEGPLAVPGAAPGPGDRPGPGAPGRSLLSFSVFGVRINIGVTWLLAALLIAWSLAVGAFPRLYKGLAPSLYWSMAVVAVVGLGVSIVLHELAHTFTARAFGVEVRRVTLFLLGGASELTEQPPSPFAEVVIALAGPVLSLVLGVAFAAVAAGAARAGGPTALVSVLHYLGLVNVVIAAFNMVPAFPLDGGRVLRALVWMGTRDLERATQIAAFIGQLLGFALIALGVLVALTGGLVQGLWEVMIGLFLRMAAGAELMHTEMSVELAQSTAREVMAHDPAVAPAEMTVAEFVHDRLYARRRDLFPVVGGGGLIGVIGMAEVAGVPQTQWALVPVAQVCTPVSADDLINAEDSARTAFRRLSGDRRGLLVVDDGRLVGVITLQDLLQRVRLQLELKGARRRRGPA
jgi:Zn-dependent protease/CBS domain-containing protein